MNQDGELCLTDFCFNRLIDEFYIKSDHFPRAFFEEFNKKNFLIEQEEKVL